MTNKQEYVSILFLLFLTIISPSAVSQYVDQEKPPQKTDLLKEDYLSVGLGFSNPNGNYKDQDLNYLYQGSGFANTGYNLNINYGKLFTQNFGLAVMLSHSSHGFNTVEIEAFNQFNDPLAAHSIVVGRYRTTGLLGGLLISFPLSNGYFDIRAMLGYSTSYAPAYTYIRTDSNSVDYFEINSSVSSALSSNIGVGFRLNFNQFLAVNFSIDYYSTRPYFQHTLTSNTFNTESIIYYLEMSMLNTTIGLAYRIPSF